MSRLLKAIIQRGIQKGVSRNPILNIYITCWIENIDGWERICLSFLFLVEMFEAIIYGMSDGNLRRTI